MRKSAVSLPKAKKRNFTQRIRTWKLRDPAIAKKYNAAFKKRMATAVLQKPAEKTGTWSSIFPNEQITEVQSSLFVKKLLAVAVSNIAYLRAIFPEHAFGDRSLEGLSLKILREDLACPGASQVIKWVKGCFDAFDKKYLRMLMIGLYTDPDDPETVIESYTFKFSYVDGGGLEIYRNDEKISGAHSEAETRKATIRLLRTIILLTQTLDALPDDIMMTMKLMYYDDVTPSDYEPPGFKAADSDTFIFEDEPMTIKVGDVNTAYHSVKVRVKTNRKQFEMKNTEGEEAEEDHIETEINSGLDEDVNMASPPKDHETSQNEITISPVNQESHVEPSTCAEIPSNSPTKPENGIDVAESEASQTPEVEEEFRVRCPCGCNEDDGLMIMCSVCKFWQHGVCFLVLEEDEAPEQHVCDACAQSEDKELDKVPTDCYLTQLTPIQIQATCLWRRALMACLDLHRVVAPDLAKRLGTEVTVAQGLLNRLDKEGFLKPSGRGKRLGKLIDKDKITAVGVPKYMKKHEKPTEAQKEVDCTGDNKAEKNDSQADFQEVKKSEVDVLAEKTEKLKLNKKKNKLSKKKQKQEEAATEVRRSPRLNTEESVEGNVPEEEYKIDKTQNERDKRRKGRKRTVSKLGQGEEEFELSSTQDVYDDPKRRKKASVVAKDIMV